MKFVILKLKTQDILRFFVRKKNHSSACAKRTVLLAVSLCNRMAERGGRQNACVWQTWCGNYFCFYFPLMLSGLLQEDLLKRGWSLAKSFVKQNYCNACPTRYAVFFPLLSCFLSSLLLKSEQLMANQIWEFCYSYYLITERLLACWLLEMLEYRPLKWHDDGPICFSAYCKWCDFPRNLLEMDV